MYALSLSSKFLIEKKHFPTFLITQIDQSSPADFVLHRPWKAPKRGVKISLILISSETSVAVKFLPWEKKKKKKDKALYDDKLLVLYSCQISMYMLNEKMFVLLLSQPVKGKTVYCISYR